MMLSPSLHYPSNLFSSPFTLPSLFRPNIQVPFLWKIIWTFRIEGKDFIFILHKPKRSHDKCKRCRKKGEIEERVDLVRKSCEGIKLLEVKQFKCERNYIISC